MASVLDQPFQKSCGCCFGNDNPDISSNFGLFEQPVSMGTDMAMEDQKKKQEVDALLSEAMNNLTFEEREKQQETIHGVDDDLSEEANIMQNALVELDNAVSEIKAGSWYETAERMNPSYVHARDFRVMFLRGNRYDVQKAAQQMLNFFEMKEKLFGIETLTRDITVEDLDEDDLACLRTGWLQVCGKDRSGRAVVVHVMGLRAWKTLRNELRTTFFMSMDLLKDEEVQLRGTVDVDFAVGKLMDIKNGAGYNEHIVMANSIPLHTAAVHFCCSEVSQYILCKIAIATMGPKLRSRFRAHIGSSLECQYILSTFGILSFNLPLVKGTSQVDMRQHSEWCRSRSVVSSSGSSIGFSLEEPTSKDVLYMRKGRSENAGNRHFRSLIGQWALTYDFGVPETKRRVVNEIVDTIHRNGGRFLCQSKSADDSTWSEVTKEEVRLKITQAFRNRRRKVNGCRRKQWN